MNCSFAVALVGLIAMPCLSMGQTPGHHPHYLHALSDLRYARYLLNRPEEHRVWMDQKEATFRIDRAIAEIKRASIDDHKNLNDHPMPDRTWQRADRLHKAAELLESAMRDLNYEEDNYRASDWRVQAVKHTHDALELTRKAMIDKSLNHR